MTLTASFDDTTAKVTLTVASAPAGATAVHLQRSVDQVTWTDVRGAQAVTVSAGAATFLDYEYAAGLTNHYRALYQNSATPHNNSASTINGRTASSVPASTTINVSSLAAVQGDFVGILVSLTAAPTSGQIGVTGAGWSIVRVGTLGALVYATWPAAGLSNPAVTVTVGSTTALSWFGFHVTNGQFIDSTAQVNASATTISWPAAPVPTGDLLVLLAARAASFVSPATPTPVFSNATEGIVSYLAVVDLGVGVISFGAGTGSAASFALAVLLSPADSIGQDTATVTPAQTQVWLKNPLRPFLNRAVSVVDIADETRDSRSGVFNVIARTLPVAVTDLQSGRSTTLTLRTTNKTDADDLDGMIAVGEVLLVQPPAPGSPVPTMYAVPGGSTRQRVANTSAVRRFPLGLTEVATPDLTLAAVQSTWVTVTNTYATWSAEVAAKTAWTDVLQLVGTAADVITS